ncbi:hypothetical protein IAT38_007349 [Cryptococcus sp. DSM 104549]
MPQHLLDFDDDILRHITLFASQSPRRLIATSFFTDPPGPSYRQGNAPLIIQPDDVALGLTCRKLFDLCGIRAR